MKNYTDMNRNELAEERSKAMLFGNTAAEKAIENAFRELERKMRREQAARK